MNLAALRSAETPALRVYQLALRAATAGSTSRRSTRRARLRPADPTELVSQVEAILQVFGPAWYGLATPIPGGDSGAGELDCLEQRGVWIAERGPLGHDGGAYLYLLAEGALGELEQWPTGLGGSEGWTGLLRAISVRRALSKYPGLSPAKLAKRLTATLGDWLKRPAAG